MAELEAMTVTDGVSEEVVARLVCPESASCFLIDESNKQHTSVTVPTTVDEATTWVPEVTMEVVTVRVVTVTGCSGRQLRFDLYRTSVNNAKKKALTFEIVTCWVSVQVLAAEAAAVEVSSIP